MSEFLSNMKRYAGLHRLLLAIVGCLPSATGQYFLPHSLTVCIFITYLCYITWENIYFAWPNDINQISYNVTPFVGFGNAITKLIIYIVLREENYELMQIVEEKFWLENVASSERERAIIEQYARTAYWFSILVMVPMCAGVPLWLCFPLLDMFVFQNNNDEPFRRVLPFNHHTLPDAYEDSRYYVIYLVQTIGVCLVITALSALDCLYVHFLMSICGQFKILQMRLKHFDEDDDGTRLTINEQVEKVKSCIEHQQHLLLVCEKLENTLYINTFAQCFASTTFMCTAGFIIIIFEGDMFIVVQNVLCLGAAMSILFFLCYTANLLTTEGEEVANAAYSSNWMDAPENLKKLLMIIIMRAQKPVYLTIGKFKPVSLSTFETVLRSAASYFTVLKSMKGKK